MYQRRGRCALMTGPPRICCPAWSMASLEEDAIVFGAELREVGHDRRGIGFEVEAVSGFRRRRGGDRNRCRVLEEVTAEFERNGSKEGGWMYDRWWPGSQNGNPGLILQPRCDGRSQARLK